MPAKKKKKTKSKPKKSRQKRTAVKARAKSTRSKARKKTTRRKREILGTPRAARPRTAVQSGDLQGVSNTQTADSESVDELLEEGNAFEAGVVDGVENAKASEVTTREVPEDDVPAEYLDRDDVA